MADLHGLLSSRLTNLKRAPDGKGWTAMCPICAASGNGLRAKNQLRIWPNSAFHCVIASSDPGHNALIRNWIYQDANPDALAALSLEIVDPDPKVEMDKVYPETDLARLTSDYRYWVNRGISEEVLRRMGGGLAPADERSKLSNRYVLPVRDSQGRIIGWTGRLVSDASFGPVWKHLVKSSRCIFPYHDAAEEIKRTRKVVLDESVGDGLSLATVGLRNRLDLLGLNLNARILGFLVSVNPRYIILSPNNDAIGRAESKNAGNKAADKLRSKLAPFFGDERIITRLPQTRKDWNKVLMENPEEIHAFKAEIDAL